jgi:hypothetical protein
MREFKTTDEGERSNRKRYNQQQSEVGKQLKDVIKAIERIRSI